MNENQQTKLNILLSKPSVDVINVRLLLSLVIFVVILLAVKTKGSNLCVSIRVL